METRLPPDTSGLEPVEGFPFTVYSSASGIRRARFVAERVDRVSRWLGASIGAVQVPPVFVLGRADWGKAALHPTYGALHVDADRMLIGQEQPDIWASFRATAWPRTAGRDEAAALPAAPGDAELARVADCFIAHETSHLAHGLESAGAPGWFYEFCANVGMIGFFTEVEPDERAVLEDFARGGWAARRDWPTRELDRMYDAFSAERGDEGVGNYLWFEAGLIVLATRLWDAAGLAGFRRLLEALAQAPVSTAQAVAGIAAVDAEVAQAVRSWPEIDPA